jgi:hypothetical protein
MSVSVSNTEEARRLRFADGQHVLDAGAVQNPRPALGEEDGTHLRVDVEGVLVSNRA